MRIYLFLPVLAFAALLNFSAGGAQAGRFFGSSNNGADSSYQYPDRSQNCFGFGPGSNCQARHSHSRHRWFHRDQGVANTGMPANAMPGYGMPPAYGMPLEQMQAPIVQSPMLTPPVHMTSMAPAAVPVLPAVQSPSCSRCGQTAQVQAPQAQAAQAQAAQVQATPAVQSRIVPVPAPMPTGPTTAEPPTAEPTGNQPF
jgi:hypothetical protein